MIPPKGLKAASLIALWLLLPGILHAHEALQPTEIEQAVGMPSTALGHEALEPNDLKAFYAARSFKPAWNFTSKDDQKSLEAFLKSLNEVVEYQGLDHRDYPIDSLAQNIGSDDVAAHLRLELGASDMILRLAHDLHGDKHELDDLYIGWNFKRAAIDVPVLLNAALTNNSASDFINSLVPRQRPYQELLKDLSAYRALATNGGWSLVDKGATLRLHDRSPRIKQVRARLVAENYITPAVADLQSDILDESLAAVIKQYQTRNGLEPDGSIGPHTLATMDVTLSDRIDQIRANLERWRHMPEDFPPSRYVMINIPNAMIDIIENNTSVYSGPVVVGRVDRKTPFINSTIRSMIINPAWHVPTSIARKDILPKLRKDPHYLEKLGFTITGRENDPQGNTIDWQKMEDEEFNFRLRQSPGEQNSLGRLKFDFDNDFAVYMHGTPHQNLFSKAARNFSSGCVRLRDPEQVGEMLMKDTKGDWNAAKIDETVQTNKTRWLGLATPIPIFIVYWTVFNDDSGAVDFRDDVYDYDTLLMNPDRARPIPENE